MEESQTAPFISIDLGPDRPALAFATAEEAHVWLGEEREFWQWFGNASLDQSLKRVWSETWQTWQRAKEALAKFDGADEEGKTAARNQVTGELRKLYAEDKFILSSEPRAQFLLRLKEEKNSRTKSQ